jgi:hypothetical protein
LLHIRIIAISCGHALHAPVPGLLVLCSLSDSAPLLSSVFVPCVPWLYVFSCCCPLLCSFSLLFIVLEGLLISLSMCIIYDKACRIIFSSIAVLCKRYFGSAQNSVLLGNARLPGLYICMEETLRRGRRIFPSGPLLKLYL